MAIFIIIVFVIGYIAIATEHVIHINKAGSALVAGVLCWAVYIMYGNSQVVTAQLQEKLSDISGILFFLVGAMTLVELIDAHDGFSIVYRKIKGNNYQGLLWIICLLSFFLSALLDNLTTAIVMVTITNKIVTNARVKMYFTGMIVIAANAGGAWSPIGDVTTTMLWISGRISALQIIFRVFLPALFCILIPLIIFSRKVKGAVEISEDEPVELPVASTERNFIFFAGIFILLMVPVFKTITGLPPYMAMTLGLGLIWIITGILHSDKDKQERHSLSVSYALERIDMPGILFFFGILLAVGALEATGMLHTLAEALHRVVPNEKVQISAIGLLSAIVDNVPLVAASIGMYPLSQYPIDHAFWPFLAYCAGTGGSLLVIGSAAGIAAMGIGKLTFGWYLKKITWPALIGFLAGIGVFLLEEVIFGG